jgi:hypothetical protein
LRPSREDHGESPIVSERTTYYVIIAIVIVVLIYLFFLRG